MEGFRKEERLGLGHDRLICHDLALLFERAIAL